MPVIKSAIKKLRKDRKRERENDLRRARLERAIRQARKSPSKSKVSEAFSLIDKAVKRNIIHKNKAARIKASLSKLLVSPKNSKVATKTPKKKTRSAK